MPSAIGFALVVAAREFRPWLERIQNQLFGLGADLSVPLEGPKPVLRIEAAHVEGLERLCDDANAFLEPFRSFVLPGEPRLQPASTSRSEI